MDNDVLLKYFVLASFSLPRCTLEEINLSPVPNGILSYWVWFVSYVDLLLIIFLGKFTKLLSFSPLIRLFSLSNSSKLLGWGMTMLTLIWFLSFSTVSSTSYSGNLKLLRCFIYVLVSFCYWNLITVRRHSEENYLWRPLLGIVELSFLSLFFTSTLSSSTCATEFGLDRRESTSPMIDSRNFRLLGLVLDYFVDSGTETCSSIMSYSSVINGVILFLL